MSRALTPTPARVLLIAPPVFDYYSTPARMEPLGLYYLKWVLDADPLIEADIYDAFLSRKSKTVMPPESFSYLDEFYREDRSPFSLFHKYYRFGDSFNKIVSVVRDGAYDFAAITSNFSAYHPDVEKLASAIRETSDATIVMGGWAVWAGGEHLSKGSAADYLIADSGLVSLPALVKRVREGSDPAYPRRREASLPVGDELSAADDGSDPFMKGFPQRPGGYYFKGRRISRVVLSRGCAHKCAFCSVHRRYNFERRPLDSVRHEMACLVSSGTGIIDLEDDNLFAGRDYTEALLAIMKGVRATGGGSPVEFTAMNGITAVNLEPYTEEALAAGFIEFNLSMVAGDAASLADINRPDFKNAIESIAWKNRGRADLLAFIICGLPGSTPVSVLDDILFLAGLPVRIGFSPYYQVPGAPLFDGVPLPHDPGLMRGSAFRHFGSRFPREDAMSLWKLTRMINYLKESSAPDPEAVEYFGRSIAEKRWYTKSVKGDWKPGFHFTAELPRKISLCSLDGAVKQYIFF
jgi:radical SAM superfamily enzyme YgiQ (UPF0313 family)